MPLVKTTENTENLIENQNPIELEIKPVKPKRQMTEAQLENLKRAREIKALKRQQSLEKPTNGLEPQTPIVIKEENPINNQESKAVKQLNKNIVKAEKLNKKLISKPIKPVNRKLIPKNIKADMEQQFRNQEISAAKELEFKSKVSQAVQIEIRKMKLAEAKEEAIKKRAQIEAEIAQKEEYEADEEEFEYEEEEEAEEEEEEDEAEPAYDVGNQEEEEEEEQEEIEEDPPSPEPIRKITPKSLPDNLKPRRVMTQRPPEIKNKDHNFAQVYQRKNPRRDYGNYFLNQLFNQ